MRDAIPCRAASCSAVRRARRLRYQGRREVGGGRWEADHAEFALAIDRLHTLSEPIYAFVSLLDPAQDRNSCAGSLFWSHGGDGLVNGRLATSFTRDAQVRPQ